MDFLNKAFAQLKDLFLSMTPGARITAGLLLAVVVISLGYLFTHRGAGANAYLMNGESFSPGDLRAMEAAFGEKGLKDYKIEGSRVRVPQGEHSTYMAALAEADALPYDFGDMLDRAINQGGVFQAKDERQARLKIAKEKQLSRLIAKMNGIENAAVVYDTQTSGGLKREEVTTAAVFVKPLGSHQLDDEIASSIRRLVVKAIAGLKPADCAVTDQNTGRTTYGGSESLGGPHDDPYLTRKRIYEQRLKDDILEVLSYVPGVIVIPNVELDRERIRREEQLKHDPKPVTYQTSDKSSSTSQDGGGAGGRVGYDAQQNAPRRLNTTQSTGSHQEQEESEQQTFSAVSSQRIEKESIGLTPKRVTVSVAVPASYFEKVWQEQNTAEPGADPKTPDENELAPIRTQVTSNIQTLVAGLLPEVEGVNDLIELVKVKEFQDITQPEIPQPGMGENALAWLGQSWSTLGLILLAFFSLFMLRSMVLAAPASTTESGAPAALSSETEEDEAEPGPKKPKGHRLRRFSTPGASLHDELSELVGEDPDTAANILRTWIGNAT